MIGAGVCRSKGSLAAIELLRRYGALGEKSAHPLILDCRVLFIGLRTAQRRLSHRHVLRPRTVCQLGKSCLGSQQLSACIGNIQFQVGGFQFGHYLSFFYSLSFVYQATVNMPGNFETHSDRGDFDVTGYLDLVRVDWLFEV